MYKDKTETIIKFYEELQESGKDSKVDDIKMLVKKCKWIPFVDKSTNKYGFFNYKQKIAVDGFSEALFIRQAQRYLGNSIPRESTKSLLDEAVTVYNVTHNPFESRNFYYLGEEDELSQVFRMNEVRPSVYREKLEDKVGDETIDLLLRSIRKNDENWIDGFSFMEIILAWQTFHNEKVIAVPCIYSKDRGMGKTTWLKVGEYLYSQTGATHYATINKAGGANANQWGDAEQDARVILYDDVPNNPKIVEELASELKAKATDGGKRLISIKGGGMILSNASNYAMTTNYLSAIPLDEGDRDRRIYPIHVMADDYSVEEMNIIKHLDMPISGQNNLDDTRFPIIQKMLNHLYHVYNKTRESKEAKFMLMKQVPSNSLKSRIAQSTISPKKLFPILVNKAKDLKSLVLTLNESYNADFSFLSLDSHAIVGEIKGRKYLFLKSKGITSLGIILANRKSTATQIYNQFFKNDYEFKMWNIGNGKSSKAIKLPLNN